MKQVLIDTDVILDFFYDRAPFSENAAKILSLCEANQIIGFITPVICSNLYYLLRKSATHKQVVDKLKQLVLIVNILHMDQDVVVKALNSDFKDFEDALQNFSAVTTNEIDTIITRNIKDYKTSNIGVLSPDQFLEEFSTNG